MSTATFQLGINYPWLNYGWDFGDPPPGWAGADVATWRGKQRQHIVADLRQFASLGLFAVRWFVLPDGTNYGFGADAPQRQGDGRWRAQPLPAEHTFYSQALTDFAFVLAACADLNLKLVPVLLDFHWAFPGATLSDGLVVKGGRADIIIDQAKRAAFFAALLEPLLEISAAYQDTIYAWELINEPEWCTNTRKRLVTDITATEKESVPLDVMRAFLADGLRIINARGVFRSTIGFAHRETIDDWDAAALGVTLHQFHYYAQNKSKLPAHRFRDEHPCFLGEFASACERDWPELVRQGRAQTIANRLDWIIEKGYPAAFLWSARGCDAATAWTPQQHKELLAFARQQEDAMHDTNISS